MVQGALPAGALYRTHKETSRKGDPFRSGSASQPAAPRVKQSSQAVARGLVAALMTLTTPAQLSGTPSSSRQRRYSQLLAHSNAQDTLP